LAFSRTEKRYCIQKKSYEYEKTIILDVFIENEFHDELKKYENNRKME